MKTHHATAEKLHPSEVTPSKTEGLLFDERPSVRLTPVEPAGPRGLGALKGLIGPEPEGFFDPLSEEELADWT